MVSLQIYKHKAKNEARFPPVKETLDTFPSPTTDIFDLGRPSQKLTLHCLRIMILMWVLAKKPT